MTGEEELQALLRAMPAEAQGNGVYGGRCPGHHDRKPSLIISVGRNGRPSVHCFAGCTSEAIYRTVGLGHLLEASTDDRPARQPLRSHHYEDVAGNVIATKLRWPPGRGPKFSWQLPDGTNSLRGLTPGLYRRPAVDAAIAEGRPIWVVEGERDADRLADDEYPATSGPFGAGSWRPGWSAPLAGSLVSVVADRDQRGIDHARSVAERLEAVGCTVTRLIPPDGFKDVTQLLDSRGLVADLDDLTDDLVLTSKPIRTTSDGRPVGTQLPITWLGVLDPHCIALAARIDVDHGLKSPIKGRNHLVREVGWSKTTIDRHLQHLEEAGILRVRRVGKKQAQYAVLNQSRSDCGPQGGPAVDRRYRVENQRGGRLDPLRSVSCAARSASEAADPRRAHSSRAGCPTPTTPDLGVEGRSRRTTARCRRTTTGLRSPGSRFDRGRANLDG